MTGSREIVNRPDRLRAALRRNGLVRRPRALRRFLRRHQLRYSDGNHLQLYAYGDAGLAAMLSAIDAAVHRVHFETYILRDDATGRMFIDALTRCARRNVAVRLLYDGVGSLTLGDRALQALRAAGGAAVVFNPLARFYPIWLPRRRDHRKLLVVDGAVAFTGGLNIGDEYNVGPQGPGEPWRDTHVRVQGPAVQELEAVFLEGWFRADGPDLPWSEVLIPASPPCGTERVAVVPDGPSYRHRSLRDLVALALRTGREHVRLTSPYFAPDYKILGALAQAGRRGLQVSLLLAGRTDHPVLRRAARALLPKLLQSGVVIYEQQQAMLHAKTSVVDRHWAMVGTSNLDRQSFEHSYEVNLVVEGGEFPAQLAALFEADLAQATPIDAAALSSRSLAERLFDRLCALVLLIV